MLEYQNFCIAIFQYMINGHYICLIELIFQFSMRNILSQIFGKHYSRYPFYQNYRRDLLILIPIRQIVTRLLFQNNYEKLKDN